MPEPVSNSPPTATDSFPSIMPLRQLLVFLLLCAALALALPSSSAAQSIKDVGSAAKELTKGRRRDAEIPQLCAAPSSRNHHKLSTCGKFGSGFRACTNVQAPGEKCTSLCYTALLARALEQRGCTPRPSIWNLHVLYGRCVSECRKAQTVMRDALRLRKKKVQALVLVSYSGGRYTAKFIPYFPYILLGPGRDLRKEQEPQNCWFCRWVGFQCPKECSKGSVWDFNYDP